MPASDNPVELFGLRLAHVGINTNSPEEAEATADALCALMGIERGEGPFPISSFAGTLVEVMNNGGRGEKGHIGLHVDDVEAAEAWYRARGVEFNEASRAMCPDDPERTYLIYFKEEIAGFAVHITVAD
ncbi:2-dehydro-3-deoxyphosphogluconate aldolase [Olsenella sp. An285]|uniref:VOC family protein n=1 Tax=Olsenella sp. An285 TaxID=1965621 RepID=UPI000B36F555|nr:2-dehydro-3-deoxyphosphogluconate aldolase [Olsenella sp. An285]OUO46462.1 2-dehydro-3-deoxyphosphogluconate aldolase [Olsenella sp. An285]